MEKRCIKCNEFKGVGEFHRDSKSVDGFRNICKLCCKKCHLDGFKKLEKNKVETIIEKECASCGKIKKLTEFHKNKYQYDGLQRVCKKCRHKYYVEKDYIRVSEYGKKRYAKMDKNVLFKLRKKRYNKNKELEKINMKKYYENNKEKIRIHNIKKRNSDAEYKTYAEKLTVDESPRLYGDSKLLEVLCKYCGKYFIPKNKEVYRRIGALNGYVEGDNYLYCSDECKNNCPTYGQKKYPRGFKNGTSREVDPFIRQLCFERDNWMCQKCGVTENLHCHHINGYAQNKILANDVDNVITLCKNCHKEIHSEIGCRYVDLRCQ